MAAIQPPLYQTLSGKYYHPFRNRSNSPQYGSCDRAMPANERNMARLSAKLRDDPRWYTRCTDPTVRRRWKEALLARKFKVTYGKVPLTESEIEYVLDELVYYSKVRDPDTGIEPSISHRIWQSDALIDDETHSALLDCAKKLESVPEDQKWRRCDYNNTTLDLIHPFMYPLVYGRTLPSSTSPALDQEPVVPDYGPLNGKHIWSSYMSTNHNAESKLFQCLPTTFAIVKNGEEFRAEALGYINGLCPTEEYRPCYRVIEELVAKFVPLWERVLGETAVGYTPPAPTIDECDYGFRATQGQEPASIPENEHTKNSSLPPLAGPFRGRPPQPIVNLKNCRLQVIVKMTNIHLTPNEPKFEGGDWHVEGLANEAIVGVGVYYYDEENITHSGVAFQMAVNYPEDYLEYDREGLTYDVWGLCGGDPQYGADPDYLVQELGTVFCKKGRCIAFPNMYQHQVLPFKLKDPTKPGYRKMISLLLVDPALAQSRPSTLHVAIQQKEWIVALVEELAATRTSYFSRIPQETRDAIVEMVDGLMTREEAQRYHRRIASEYKDRGDRINSEMFETMFFIKGVYSDSDDDGLGYGGYDDSDDDFY